MHPKVRGTINRAITVAHHTAQRFAGSVMPIFGDGLGHGGRFEGITQAEMIKHPGCVRCQCDAGPLVDKLRRSFVDLNRKPSLRQRQRGRQATDPAANNSDMHNKAPFCAGHGFSASVDTILT